MEAQRPRHPGVWGRVIGGTEEKEAARPSSPSSTPRLRATALEPGLLPPTQHRVVHPGPRLLLDKLASPIQEAPDTPTSTAPLASCPTKERASAAAVTVADPQ